MWDKVSFGTQVNFTHEFLKTVMSIILLRVDTLLRLH
jgi:hypothetical protein